MAGLTLVDDACDLDVARIVDELRTLRRDAGLTLTDVAEHVGVSRRLPAYWENLERQPPLLHLAAWAAMLHRPLPAKVVFDAFVDDLRRQRGRAGHTQADLAALLGVTKNTFSRWERCWSRPTRRQLEAWAGVFGRKAPGFLVMPRLTTAECGYLSGRRRHSRRGEPLCALCADIPDDIRRAA